MTENNLNNNIEIIPLIIEGAQDIKGKAITVVDMSSIEAAPTPQFIIVEGSSTMQVASIADNIREHLLDKANIKPYNYDGYTNSEWIVIDYGPVLVHVFIPEARQKYNLEELWSDAVITNIPDLD